MSNPEDSFPQKERICDVISPEVETLGTQNLACRLQLPFAKQTIYSDSPDHVLQNDIRHV